MPSCLRDSGIFRLCSALVFVSNHSGKGCGENNLRRSVVAKEPLGEQSKSQAAWFLIYLQDISCCCAELSLNKRGGLFLSHFRILCWFGSIDYRYQHLKCLMGKPARERLSLGCHVSVQCQEGNFSNFGKVSCLSTKHIWAMIWRGNKDHLPTYYLSHRTIDPFNCPQKKDMLWILKIIL